MWRVLVFTDEPIAAEGLECVLKRAGGFRVTTAPNDPATLIERAEALRPELMLLDMTPDLTYGVMVELQKRLPTSRVVVWVRTISRELAFQALEHGIRGILPKTLSAEKVVKCLRLVSEGGLWFEESLKDSFLAAEPIRLSKRESELVSLLAQGLKNKEIAATLNISNGTVKVYLSRLFRKLGVKDRFELALFGLRNLPEADIRSRQERRRPEARSPGIQASRSRWLRSLLLDRPEDRLQGIVS